MKGEKLNVAWLPVIIVLFLLPGFISVPKTLSAQIGSQVKIYSAPKEEKLSTLYKVSVSGKALPVYNVKVGAADNERRFKAVDDLLNSEKYYDLAAFAYFDLKGSTTVTVSIDKPITSAKVLPASANIKTKISNKSVSFSVSSPQNLTIEINDEWVKSLHVFVNPIETNVPKPTDPNVIYFGPGIHEVTNLVIGDNKTVYIAGGAIVRTVVGPKEAFGIEPSGLRNYAPSFDLKGKNITFKGRGIIDAGWAPTHARHILNVNGSDIKIEGVILKDPTGWAFPIRMCDNVKVDNVKIMGYRANSDGIDIGSSRKVTIENCFIRTNDDLIVVKSWKGAGQVKDIIVRKCVLWNQLAHALSLGAELGENVDNVLFTDCDIIHDTGREWALRVFHTDAALISNVRFENIRVENTRNLISLWVGKIASSFDKEHGRIRGVSFKNIKAFGDPLVVDLAGAGEQNAVENVVLENIFLNGKRMRKDHVHANKFVKNLQVK